MSSTTETMTTSKSGSLQWARGLEDGSTISKRGDPGLITIAAGEVGSPALTMLWILLRNENTLPRTDCDFTPLIIMRNLYRIKVPGRSKRTSRMLICTDSMPTPPPITHCRTRDCPGFWDSTVRTMIPGVPPPPPPPTQKKKGIFLDNQFLNPGPRDMPTIQMTFQARLLHSPLLSLVRGQLNPRRKGDTRAKTVLFLNLVSCGDHV